MNEYEVVFTEDGAKVGESNPLAIVASAMTAGEDWLQFHYYNDCIISISRRLVAYGRVAASPTLSTAEEATSKFEERPMKFIVTLKTSKETYFREQIQVEAEKVTAANGFVQFITKEHGPVAAFNQEEVLGWEREPTAKSIFKVR